MTLEQKDLLLKDLCARIPYGVKLQFEDTIEIIKEIWFCEDEGWQVDGEKTSTCIHTVKPYLFPLSSMTEEQKADCPISETNLNIIISNIGCYGIIEIPWRLSFLFVDWCNKNHFDYRGLIPLNLANDATGLNIY